MQRAAIYLVLFFTLGGCQHEVTPATEAYQVKLSFQHLVGTQVLSFNTP